MRKFTLTTVLVCTLFATGFAQVGIGTATPNPSSVLDLTSTTKAFLPPRMTTVQRDAIASPVAGMTIFNTTTTCIEFFNGTAWYNACTGTTSGGSGGGGGSTSNSVAASNLIAHWTFDTDSKEAISSTAAAAAVGVTYSSAGKIGNCASFSNGYLYYPAIAKISLDTAMQSYTISMWVNLPAGNTGILRSLFQVNPTTYPDIWGAASLSLNNNGITGDTLPLRVDQVQIDGRGPTQASAFYNFGGGAGKWTLLTETYDGTSTNQTIKLYANGALVYTTGFTDVDKSPTSTSSTFRVVPTGGPSFPGGNAAAANYVSIGTLAFKDRGNDKGNGYSPTTYAPNVADRPWAAGSITGSLDDIRLFNKALSASEVMQLYTYGSTGQ